jgi:membrane-bound lytic murein transglycosylase B
MTVAELHEAILNNPNKDVAKCVPDNAESFARYLRQAGVKKYDKLGKPQHGGSVRRREDLQ